MMTVEGNRFYGEFAGCVMSNSPYFDDCAEPAWFDDPEVGEIIKDIDNTYMVNSRLFYSDELGVISKEDLSGGAKGLILILKSEKYRCFSSTAFGDNCNIWLARLSFEVDFTIVLNHPLAMWGNYPINAITKEGTLITKSDDIVRYYLAAYREEQPVEDFVDGTEED